MGFAEIAWRWSFGAAFWAVAIFTFREYLTTLPVRDADLALLRTRQPALILKALAHIFHGSSFRFVEAAVILTAALSLAWIVIASLGRAAIVKHLVSHFRAEASRSNPNLRSLFGIQFLRVITAWAAIAGFVAAAIIAGTASSPRNPAPGGAMAIFAGIAILIAFAWNLLGWVLSLAVLFAITRGHGLFAAIRQALSLSVDRAGSLAAVGFWFGLVHLVIFSLASSTAAFPLSVAALAPPAVTLAALAVVALLYFACVDYIRVGRLAAQIAIIEWPLLRPDEVPVPTSARTDPDELILCDIPVS